MGSKRRSSTKLPLLVVVRLLQDRVRISSKVSTPVLSNSKRCSTTFLLYLGLSNEDKRVLEEFCGTESSTPTDTTDLEATPEDGGVLKFLEQEGTAQGFIDDIQGLLDGR